MLARQLPRRGAVQLSTGLSWLPAKQANSKHSSAGLRRPVRTDFVLCPTLERSGSIHSIARLLATLVILWMICRAIFSAKCHSCSNSCVSQALHMHSGCDFMFYSIGSHCSLAQVPYAASSRSPAPFLRLNLTNTWLWGASHQIGLLSQWKTVHLFLGGSYSL